MAMPRLPGSVTCCWPRVVNGDAPVTRQCNVLLVEACRRQREAEEAVAYILHTVRSWAQLRASPADRPQSEQIWCSQVIGGRPRGLHQFGKGVTPSRASHATRRTALSGTLSGIRATWPNSERW